MTPYLHLPAHPEAAPGTIHLRCKTCATGLCGATPPLRGQLRKPEATPSSEARKCPGCLEARGEYVFDNAPVPRVAGIRFVCPGCGALIYGAAGE